MKIEYGMGEKSVIILFLCCSLYSGILMFTSDELKDIYRTEGLLFLTRHKLKKLLY